MLEKHLPLYGVLDLLCVLGVEGVRSVCPKSKAALFDNDRMYSNKRFLAQTHLAGSKFGLLLSVMM